MTQIRQYLQDGFAGDVTALAGLQLLCRFTHEDAARFCLVSPETYRGWRSGRSANRTAVRLLAIRAGWVPWPGWDGWMCVNGVLIPPDWSNWTFTPGQILALPLLHQQLAALKDELARARASAASSQAQPCDLKPPSA